jgi:hypothetical protein
MRIVAVALRFRYARIQRRTRCFTGFRFEVVARKLCKCQILANLLFKEYGCRARSFQRVRLQSPFEKCWLAGSAEKIAVVISGDVRRGLRVSILNLRSSVLVVIVCNAQGRSQIFAEPLTILPSSNFSSAVPKVIFKATLSSSLSRIPRSSVSRVALIPNPHTPSPLQEVVSPTSS